MGQSASSDLKLVRFDIEIEINASPDRVWAEPVDVERWPEWMASYTSVERLSEGRRPSEVRPGCCNPA